MVNFKLCEQDEKNEFQQLQPKKVATPTSPLTVSIIISQLSFYAIMLYRNEEKKRAKQLVMTARCSVKVLSVSRDKDNNDYVNDNDTDNDNDNDNDHDNNNNNNNNNNFRLVRSLLDPSQCHYTATYSIFVVDSLLTLFSAESAKLASARNKCPHAPHSEREKMLVSLPSLSFCEPTVFSAVGTPIFLGCNVLASDS